jgi:eukaryotic-like serine/threonine-protein kinase
VGARVSDQLPDEVQQCLTELGVHYSDFQKVTRGASGYLWFAKNRLTQAEVAIKFYAGESGALRHDEPRLLSQLQSANILSIHDARNVSEDWAYFITPRCDGGDLDDYIKSRPSVHASVDAILGISHGVSEIHSHGMVHRDLKPANIVMDGAVPRIADFGTVRVLDAASSVTTASQHSGLYRPPESWITNTYTRSGDVYQLGLVAYQLLGGVLPYDGRQYLSNSQHKLYEAMSDECERSLLVDAAMLKRAQNCTLANFSTLPPWISAAGKRSLRQLLHPNPAERISSMADLTAAMHRLRGETADWSFNGTVAILATQDKNYELRPTGSGEFEPFQRKNGAFRRVPGLSPGTLSELVRACSSRV